MAIKLNILKSYGLLNLVQDTDLNILTDPWKTIFYDYFQNINGNYKYNYQKRIKSDDNEYHIFTALQEYIFLQKGDFADRFFRLIPLSFMFFKFKHLLRSTKNNIRVELDLNKCVCLYYLRIFQLLYKFRLSKIVPKSVLNKYEKLIVRQIEMAKELNDLSTYRFALKEYLYTKGLFRKYFNIETHKLVNEIIEIYKLNIDTNYFIDANNLLRFGATVVEPYLFKEPFLLSAELTQDKLNLNKVKHHK